MSSQSDASIGCVICSDNFDDQEEIIVTSCGHLYHGYCLKNWFKSARELNAGRTCPDCRRTISEETDVKPVFAHLVSPNNSHLDELMRAKADISVLHRQLFAARKNIAVVKKELTTQKAKVTRLNNKLGKLSEQLTDETERYDSKRRAFNETKANDADDDDDNVATRKLRNRQYNYRL